MTVLGVCVAAVLNDRCHMDSDRAATIEDWESASFNCDNPQQQAAS